MDACIIMILGKLMALLRLTLNNEYVSMGSSGLGTDPVSMLVDSGWARRQVTAPSDTGVGIMNVTLRRRLKTNIFNFKIGRRFAAALK